MAEALHNAKAFDTPRIVQRVGPHYPYFGDEDLDTREYTDKVQVSPAGYERLKLGTPHPVDPECFLTRETKPRPIEGGALYEYERLYTSLPKERYVPQAIAFERPGLETNSTAGTFSITAYSYESNSDLGHAVHSFTISDTSDFVVGSTYRFQASVAESTKIKGRATLTYRGFNISISATVLAKTSTKLQISWQDFIGRRIFDALNRQGRASVTLTLNYAPQSGLFPGVLYYQYARGLSDGVALLQKQFQVLNSASNNVTTINDSTNPTYDEYLELIAGNSLIATEDSDIRRYQGSGDIYEIITPMVFAP